MKRIFSILIAFVLYGAATLAQTWNLSFTAYKATKLTYVPHLREVNKVGFMGSVDSVIYWANKDTVRAGASLFTVSNGKAKAVSPHLNFIDPRSYVWSAARTEDGKTYVSAGEFASGAGAGLAYRLKYILNEMVYNYPIKFSGNIKFHLYEGNKKMLIYGGAYSAEDKEGEKVIESTAFLDLENEIITPSPVKISGYRDHSVGSDGTLGIISSQGDLHIFKNGEWIELPIIPHEQNMRICVINRDTIFVVTRRDSDAVHSLYFLEENKRKVLGSFSSRDSTSSSPVDQTAVFSLRGTKNKLIITHSGISFNNHSVNNIMVLDLLTDDIQSIQYPSGLNRNNFDKSFANVVGDSIYLMEENSNNFLGKSRIWLLTFSQATAWHYTFTGNGNWSNVQNWAYGFKPPASLPAGKAIIINPAADGECILDVQQTIESNASFQVAPGKRFRVVGDLIIGN